MPTRKRKPTPKLRRLLLTAEEINNVRWIVWEFLLNPDQRSRLRCDMQASVVSALAQMNTVLDGRK